MSSYVAFLVIGVLLVLVDGQLIRRSGQEYLEKTYGNSATARSVTQLVVVLFHFVVLGLLALLSIVPVNTGSEIRNVVFQVGIALLMIAAAHGGTIAILGQIRNRQREDKITDDIVQRRKRQQNPHWGTHSTVNPVENDNDQQAAVSPSIDERGPYSSTG